MTAPDDREAEILRSLKERAKELSCLYRVEEITSAPATSLEDLLRSVIEAIPPGWQYPEVCAARITLDGQTQAAPAFEQTPWLLRAPILVQGESRGLIEVAYTRPTPQS